MKQIKTIMLAIALISAQSSWAATDVIIGDLTYNIFVTTATVTSKSPSCTGNVVIPSLVTYNGSSYTVTSIGENAFYYYSGLTSVSIPNSVTSLGDYAFYHSGLTSVTIPSSVTSIGNGAFFCCSGLTSIVVNSGNSIYDSRNNCNAIIETASNTLIAGCKNTVIPESVTSIGSDAFSGCSGLASVTIPESVTSIGKWAFSGCSGLTSVTIPNSVTSIGDGVFSDCSGLTSVAIPNSVTSIGAYAFKRCSGLTSVTIGNSVTSIGNGAFSGCSGLTSVTIPNSVTSIDSYAFSGCSGLTSVTVHIKTPLSISPTAFPNRANATLYVPAGSKAAYETANFWNEFKEIKEFDLTPLTLTAKAYTREYGEVNPSFGYKMEGGPAFGTPVLSCEVSTTSPVGEYPIVISRGSVTNDSVTFVNGTLTIVPAPLTITAQSYTRYKGQDNPTFEVSYSGFKNGENASVLTTQPTISCAASSDSPAGTYEIIPSGAEDQNYDINYVNGTLTIVAPATISAVNMTMEYGEALPELTYNATGGALNGIPQLSTTATSASPVGIYPITITQGSVNNPNVTYTNGTLTITKAPLTITAKSYRRNTECDNPVFEVTYSGFKNGEDASVLAKRPSINCNATSSSPIGTYDIIPSGAEAENYEISYVNGTLTIAEYIEFADNAVRTLCLNNWDTNNDGILTMEEAAAVTNIGTIFQNKSNITSFNELRYFTGLTSIPASAFSGCTNLASIVIPESVTSIGDYALGTGNSIKSLTIGSGVQTISNRAFDRSYSYSSNTKPIKTIWLTNTPPTNYTYAAGTMNYVSNNQYTSISNTKKTVYSFLSSMFEVDGVKYVPISPSERTCDAIDCRYDASSQTVNVGKTVNYQGIDMTVKSVKPYAFYQNNQVKDAHLSFNGGIGAYAFSGITGELSVTLGENINSIGDYAFSGCTSLEEISLPNGVTTIGSYAFSGCTGLNTINIGASVSTINSYAFNACSSLQSIIIPASVQIIDNYVFTGCSSLSVVDMEYGELNLSLGSNGNNPLFADCPLDSVYIGRDISYQTSSSYGYSPFYHNTTLRSVTITDLEKEISDNEFYGCTNLKNVRIGDGVTSIGKWAFSGCSSLDYFAFGSSVTTIGQEAFSDCTSVTNIISRAATPPTCGTQALDDINKWTCHLSVLPGTASAYQTANQWKEFFYIEETAQGDQPVARVTLSNHSVVLEEIGGTIQLTATVLPYAAVNKHVVWSSDNEQVATVENGMVTAIGYGTAHITATSEEDADKKDICLVTVRVSLAQALAELQAAIAEAQELYDNSTEGVQPGQYEEGARAELLEVIVQARTVANAGTDYDAIVQSVDDINEAIDIFESKMVTIAPSNALSIEPVTISSGKNTMLSISLTNEDEIIMTDFYLQLPEGLSIAKDEDDYYDVTINGERSNRHVLEVDMNSEGLYHFLCYSSKNNALKGNDGVLFSVNLQCNENVETGIYYGMLKTIVMADIDRNEITQPNYTFIINVQDIEPGDVNGDGRINGLDIVEMVDHIMERPSDNFNFDAAELTGDGMVNGMDLVELVSIIMAQSSGAQGAPALIKGIGEQNGESLNLTVDGSGRVMMGTEAEGDFVLAQCVVELSEGMTLQDITTDDSHNVVWQQTGEGRYMVLAYSTRNDVFRSNEELLTIAFSGEGNIQVREALLVDGDRVGRWCRSAGLDTATGIASVDINGDVDVYDLGGRKILNGKSPKRRLAKGIYIVNGKKMLVK